MNTDSGINLYLSNLSACVVLQMKIVNISIFERARIDLLGSLSDTPGLDIARLGMQSL